jgi:hypothetical protein
LHPQKKREVRPAGRKDVYFFIFEKQFCCAVVTNSSISVNADREKYAFGA